MVMVGADLTLEELHQRCQMTTVHMPLVPGYRQREQDQDTTKGQGIFHLARLSALLGVTETVGIALTTNKLEPARGILRAVVLSWAICYEPRVSTVRACNVTPNGEEALLSRMIEGVTCVVCEHHSVSCLDILFGEVLL